MKIELIKQKEYEPTLFVNHEIFECSDRVVLTNLKINKKPFIELKDKEFINEVLVNVIKKYKVNEYCFVIMGEAYYDDKLFKYPSLRYTINFFNKNRGKTFFIRTNNLSTLYDNINHLPSIFWLGKSIDKSTSNIKKFENHFLIMINRLRPWRVQFMDLLKNNNILNYSKYSFNIENIEFGVHYKGYKSLEETKFDSFDKNDMAQIFHVKDYFHKCFINIIVETYYDNNVIFITEKTDKALLAKQPFIMVGGYKTLDMLKQIGFKTFDKWWSEEYDLIQNPHDRMVSILKIMNEIKSWDLKKCENIYKEMLPIIEHNYQRRMWIRDNHQFMDAYSDLDYLRI